MGECQKCWFVADRTQCPNSFSTMTLHLIIEIEMNTRDETIYCKSHSLSASPGHSIRQIAVGPSYQMKRIRAGCCSSLV
jgi:hypothetical protein